MKHCLSPVLLLFPILLFAQSEAYQKGKADQLAGPSPFQDEIDGKYPDRIAYEDDLVLVLNSFAPQAPVHVLIIPRKRIPTINDLTDADSAVIARMFWAAKKIAEERGIAETGEGGIRLDQSGEHGSGQRPQGHHVVAHAVPDEGGQSQHEDRDGREQQHRQPGRELFDEQVMQSSP